MKMATKIIDADWMHWPYLPYGKLVSNIARFATYQKGRRNKMNYANCDGRLFPSITRNFLALPNSFQGSVTIKLHNNCPVVCCLFDKYMYWVWKAVQCWSHLVKHPVSIKTHHLCETAQSSKPCVMAYISHRLGPQKTFVMTQEDLSPSVTRIIHDIRLGSWH